MDPEGANQHLRRDDAVGAEDPNEEKFPFGRSFHNMIWDEVYEKVCEKVLKEQEDRCDARRKIERDLSIKARQALYGTKYDEYTGDQKIFLAWNRNYPASGRLDEDVSSEIRKYCEIMIGMRHVLCMEIEEDYFTGRYRWSIPVCPACELGDDRNKKPMNPKCDSKHTKEECHCLELEWQPLPTEEFFDHVNRQRSDCGGHERLWFVMHETAMQISKKDMTKKYSELVGWILTEASRDYENERKSNKRRMKKFTGLQKK